jgi:hypothetical protein
VAFTRESLAWAAGLFEGEGCFSFVSSTRRYYLQLSTTDLDVLESFKNVVGQGKIYGPFTGKKSTKPYWMWNTTTFEAAQAVTAMLWPWLHLRRRSKAKRLLLSYLSEVREARKPFRLSPRLSSNDRQEIKRLSEQGATRADLARLYNRSPSTISLSVRGLRGAA